MGYVYFVRAALVGLIKIGYTGEAPDLRFFGLDGASPVPLERIGIISGDRRKERQLHIRFAHLRERGEWFRPEAELLDFIRTRVAPWPESSFGQSQRGPAEWAAQQRRVMEPPMVPIDLPTTIHPDAARFIAMNRAKREGLKRDPAHPWPID